MYFTAKIAYSVPHSVVSLAEGMPNEETFPFTEITLKLVGGRSFVLQGEELAAALQYIPSQGYPPLLQAIREFQKRAHAPPLWESRDVVVVSGGQDGLSKALEAIIGPGDPILVQDPYYPGAGVVVSGNARKLIQQTRLQFEMFYYQFIFIFVSILFIYSLILMITGSA